MAMTKERPILFSGPMIHALLEGKSQTRRVIKPTQPRADGLWPAGRNPLEDCPYGQPGDRLWVRETWRTAASLDHLSPAEVEAMARAQGCVHGPFAPVLYLADGASLTADIPEGGWGKTRVSIHMPRWASRLTLEVTEVRVQRLQEMTADDVRAEGLDVPDDPIVALTAFADLWTSINGTWDCRAWVWAISFKVLP